MQVACPYCWQPVTVPVEGQGDAEFVIECEVCCRPITVRLIRGADGEIEAEARREDE